MEVGTGLAVLYQPRLPVEYNSWMGHIRSPAETRERYGVDEVRYTDEMATHLRSLGERGKPVLLLLQGPNTDSGKSTRPAAFPGLSEFETDRSRLHPVMADCRVHKSAMELEVLRYASNVSSLAHMHVMRTLKPGMMEYQACRLAIISGL